MRRKLQVYCGKNEDFVYLLDFTVSDVPKVMSWGHEYLCVGFKAEYMLYDVSIWYNIYSYGDQDIFECLTEY